MIRRQPVTTRTDTLFPYTTLFRSLYHRDDPVVHACIAAIACFTWCEMPVLVELRQRHRDFLERGEYYGVANGITVPAFVLGERSGSCNFCSPRVPGCVRRHLWAVHTIGGDRKSTRLNSSH